MDKSNNDAKTKIDKTILEMNNFISNNSSGQFLLVGMDDEGIEEAIFKIESDYEMVVVKERELFFKNRIFLIYLDRQIQQSLIYYYLELYKKENCFVILISKSATCLNSFEKRVKSRFSNRIFFLPKIFTKNYLRENYLQNRSKNGINPKFSKNNPKIKLPIGSKNLSQKFSVDFILSFLEPIHYALILISFENKLKYTNVVELYRKYAPVEIQKATPFSILSGYYDLLDMSVFNDFGDLLIYKGEIVDFIKKKGTNYMRKYLDENA